MDYFTCVFHIVIVLTAFSLSDAQKGYYRGCYLDNEGQRDLPYRTNVPDAGVTADNCIDACVQNYYMFAGIQARSVCHCGASYGKYGPDNCTVRCEHNATQWCGDINANSVYETGFIVPGPPRNITLIMARENSLVVRWMPPLAPNGVIVHYEVEASFLSSYLPDQPPTKALRWQHANTTFETELPGLLPGAQYNVTVHASTVVGNGVGLSITLWTDIGDPEHPPAPQIVNKEGSQMSIQLPKIPATKGPITAYQVVVYDESANIPFDRMRLTNFSMAEFLHLPYYIAAELTPNEASEKFVVGSGHSSGGFSNPPLAEDKSYTVLVGVISELNGVRKASYSDPAVYYVKFSGLDESSDKLDKEGRTTPAGFFLDKPEGPDVYSDDSEIHQQGEVYDDTALVTGLGVAVGVGAALLIASVIIYFLLRRHYGQRHASDHQELTLQSPSSEPVSENGMMSSVLVLDEEADIDFVFDSLKDKFWQIPRPYLEITDEVLGQGRFGYVRKGVAYRRSQQIPVMVHMSKAHVVENEREKRAFLSDLDALVRIGIHVNVIGLVGGCEDRDLYHICIEYFSDSLKEILLNSRAVDHYPVYAEKQQRISKLHERQLLELASGVARGMSHVAHNKIVHRNLKARSIVVVDGLIPKVADFGIAHIDQEPQFDITRWTSAEGLKSYSFTTKSDIWSFGVVMWEIFTLGGTPYGNVKSRDVPARIIRGSRLPQPKNVGDDVYQLMLQCWQVDRDERPSFVELATVLENMAGEEFHPDHLHLDLFPGFQYEKYDQELEICG